MKQKQACLCALPLVAEYRVERGMLSPLSVDGAIVTTDVRTR